jgi:hypothetical protein
MIAGSLPAAAMTPVRVGVDESICKIDPVA